MPRPIDEFTNSLKTHMAVYGVDLSVPALEKLNRYYGLLLKWNDRLHLVAPCSPDKFATRHVLESLMLIPHLSMNARVADIGSGAGLPIIPCLLVREDISVALFEASVRKAVFLREALRAVDCQKRGEVIARRFQDVPTPDVNFVTCRALDRFSRWLPALIEWSPPTSVLLLFAGKEILKQVERVFPLLSCEKIPKSEGRFLIVAGRECTRAGTKNR
jgi:16S rRNA (guanine527-N7)-methyltransferase